VLALAPAAAFAQGAGDDQYSDPFGSENEQATPTPTRSAPRPTATPAQSQPAPTATAAAPRATATPSGSGGGGTLPYTGLDGWPVAITGVLMLGGGLALRARLREPD
jgi:hypothetical protein